MPHLAIPKPKNKLKSLNWTKIPSQKVILAERPNIWSLMASDTQLKNIDVDFDTLEGLFSQQNSTSKLSFDSGNTLPRVNRNLLPTINGQLEVDYGSKNRDNKILKRVSNDSPSMNGSDFTLNLLDGKKSLSVNIFLKQFRGSVDELISLLLIGNHQAIGMERLRSLMKLLPETQESEILLSHKNEMNKMPIAEKFLLQLLGIPK